MNPNPPMNVRTSTNQEPSTSASASTTMSGVRLADLTVTYRGGRVHALNHLTADLPAGMVGLLGPNGAGKTTLMRVITGVLPPTSGTVFVNGADIGVAGQRRQMQATLGYLPQDLGLYLDLTAGQFLDYIAILKGVTDRAARRRRVREVLEVVALDAVAGRKLKTYSGGMKRRIGIAQAILTDPRVLVVDEPTAGLDPEERLRFRNLLATLSGNRTVLLSTHIVEDITQTCPQVVVLNRGRIAYHGSTAALAGKATGVVWLLTRPAGAAAPDLPVISVTPSPTATQYRVVARVRPGPDATPTEPTVEDGYVALMQVATDSRRSGSDGSQM